MWKVLGSVSCPKHQLDNSKTQSPGGWREELCSVWELLPGSLCRGTARQFHSSCLSHKSKHQHGPPLAPRPPLQSRMCSFREVTGYIPIQNTSFVAKLYVRERNKVCPQRLLWDWDRRMAMKGSLSYMVDSAWNSNNRQTDRQSPFKQYVNRHKH